VARTSSEGVLTDPLHNDLVESEPWNDQPRNRRAEGSSPTNISSQRCASTYGSTLRLELGPARSGGIASHCTAGG